MDYIDLIEKASKATWERCRSSADRKSGATWESVTEETRNAWRDGTKHAFVASGIPELVCELQEYKVRDLIIEKLDPGA